MRKRRADSTLFNLPEPTQRAIFRLEEDGQTLKEIQSLLEMPEAEEGFGVGYVSLSSLSNFLKEWRTRAWRESLHAAAATAEEVDGSIDEADRDRMDQGILDGLREIILDGMTSRSIDAKSAKSLVGLILKAQAQQLDERKLALLEKKAAQADEAAGVAQDENLNPEQKESKFKEIFGIG